MTRRAGRAGRRRGGRRGRRGTPRSPPPGRSASALTVTSRRRRSSSSVAGRTSGSAPGRGVGLRPGAHEVVRAAVAGAHGGGAEALVHRRLPRAQALRRGAEVALDDEVELAGLAAEEEVADRPADEADPVPGAEDVGDPRAAGQRPQRLEGLVRRPHAGMVAAGAARRPAGLGPGGAGVADGRGAGAAVAAAGTGSPPRAARGSPPEPGAPPRGRSAASSGDRRAPGARRTQDATRPRSAARGARAGRRPPSGGAPGPGRPCAEPPRSGPRGQLHAVRVPRRRGARSARSASAPAAERPPRPRPRSTPARRCRPAARWSFASAIVCCP